MLRCGAQLKHGNLKLSISLSSQRRLVHAAPDPRTSPAHPYADYKIKDVSNNPETYKKICELRNYIADSKRPHEIARLYPEWLDIRHKLNQAQRRANLCGEEIRDLHSGSSLSEDGGNLEERKAAARETAHQLKKEVSSLSLQANDLSARLRSLSATLPNTISERTPLGKEPKLVSLINSKAKPGPDPVGERDHVKIGSEFDLLDFSSAARTTGWGWYFLKNEAALLEQALVSYALYIARRHGFSVVTPPSIAYTDIAAGCGYRPRDPDDAQQTYAIEQSKDDRTKGRPSRVLAGTAEIPFAGMKTGHVFEARELPLKIVGSSRCYRAEAGAHGVQTKGLYRVREFTKVELFAWTLLDEEEEVMAKMGKVQTAIIEGLGLHARVLEMPTEELGASAHRKQDIEVYFPSRDRAGADEGWGEVTSTSICTDYQSRRLDTRVKRPGISRLEHVGTVNGTALAVPRILAAVLEYGWSGEDGSIVVPEVLKPWMHGIERIRRPSS